MRQTAMTAAAIAAASAAAIAGCADREDAKEENGVVDAATQACAGDEIAVSDAWVRAARAGQPTSAVYLTLCNGGGTGDALVAVAVEGVRSAELHVTSMSNEGIAIMTPTARIDLPVGEAVTLSPGGAHIMLIGLSGPIAAEEAPVLRLEFENAPAQEIALEVRDAAGGHH